MLRYVWPVRFGPACSACSAAWARGPRPLEPGRRRWLGPRPAHVVPPAPAPPEPDRPACTTTTASGPVLQPLVGRDLLAGRQHTLACSIQIRLVNACRSCAISRFRPTSSTVTSLPAPRLAVRPDSSRPNDTGPRCDSSTIGRSGRGRVTGSQFPVAQVGLTVRTAASARPGPGAKAARSRSDSPPQTPYRSPYWIA